MAAFEVTGIIFNTFDEAGRFEHFEIVFNALTEALFLEVFMLLVEEFFTLFILGANFTDG